MNSQTEENYLKAIFSLEHQGESGKVSTSSLAEKLGLKPASISDKIKKLAEKSLIEYEKSKGVKLTKPGRLLAIKIVRKHRIWETFLVKKLNFGWDEVHDLAEQLEHIRSDELVNRIDDLLGHPQFDPHGDPIPDRNGKIPSIDLVTLNEAKIGGMYTFTAVEEDDPAFLQLINKLELNIGDVLHIIGKEDYDGSMSIKLKDKAMALSEKVGARIKVKPYTT